MKCLLTNKETKTTTNGRFPISPEGRKLLPEVVAKHNERIKEAFIEAHQEKGVTDELLAKLAPKVSTKYALDLLNKQEPDMMETLDLVRGKDAD